MPEPTPPKKFVIKKRKLITRPAVKGAVAPAADAAEGAESDSAIEEASSPVAPAATAEPAVPEEAAGSPESSASLARTDRIAPPKARPDTIMQELPTELGRSGVGASEVAKTPPVKFYCIRCGQKLAVPGAGVGKKILCPNCRNPIVIPPPLD